MRISHACWRWAARGGTATVAAIALAGGMQAGGAQASAAGPPATANPYSPAYHHPYRQGVIPTRPQLAKMRTWARSHPAAAASPNDLNYGGGIDGIGVTTGQEKVYLVFYGSQWGTQSTNASGDITLSGDPSGEAPYLQELFKGLGTNGELWSGVMTQYCDGVAVGAQSCPASNTQHVAYPSGGVLAGVWVDESAASPVQATPFQLGTEAVRAAAHFGNTTAAANRDAQYDIVSPTGTHPDGSNTRGASAPGTTTTVTSARPRPTATSRSPTRRTSPTRARAAARTTSTPAPPARSTASRSSWATSTRRRSPTRTRPVAGPTRPVRRTRTSARGYAGNHRWGARRHVHHRFVRDAGYLVQRRRRRRRRVRGQPPNRGQRRRRRGSTVTAA